MIRIRTLVALLCIAIVALATVMPAGSSHFTAVLMPLWVVLFPVLEFVRLRRSTTHPPEQTVSLGALLPSRAPPFAA